MHKYIYNGLHTLTAEISTSRDLRGWQFQKLWISQNLTTWFEDSHGEIFHMKLFKQNAYLFSPKLRYIQLPSFSVLIAELPICNCNTDWKERENEFCWTSFWSQVVKINSAKSLIAKISAPKVFYLHLICIYIKDILIATPLRSCLTQWSLLDLSFLQFPSLLFFINLFLFVINWTRLKQKWVWYILTEISYEKKEESKAIANH